MPIEYTDPRTAYAQPPYKNQDKIDPPGLTTQMDPSPDHGEESYVGHGQLQDRVAVITGGDSGIGRAVAIAYAREGAKIVLAYLDESDDANATLDLVKQAGVSAIAFAGDLSEEATCQRLVDTAKSEFGRIDILVNNAAHQRTRQSLDAMESPLFDTIMKTNVYAPFWLSKAAAPHIQPGGSIINTVSIQGYDPTDMLLPYATSKSALIGMTKALAKLLIEQGIRVNGVAPGPVWTPFIPSTMPKDAFEKFGGSTEFGRPAQPVELAPLYVWLASAQASYVTAEIYGATGGKSPV
jgi:NAD(P)-dependent dehydrogenase (short-subunit alcohol dehydrogenase family)